MKNFMLYVVLPVAIGLIIFDQFIPQSVKDSVEDSIQTQFQLSTEYNTTLDFSEDASLDELMENMDILEGDLASLEAELGDFRGNSVRLDELEKILEKYWEMRAYAVTTMQKQREPAYQDERTIAIKEAKLAIRAWASAAIYLNKVECERYLATLKNQ